MSLQKPLYLIVQSVTVGLALAFLILIWRPELLDHGKKVVQIVEAGSEALSAGSGPVSYAAAVQAAAPSVVNVYTRKRVQDRSSSLFNDPLFRRFFGDSLGAQPREREETSLGSGVIVSDQGYILTNNHVIEGADEIQVALHDGRTSPATVIGADPEADLAVLKVKLDNLPAITLGHSDKLRVGDVVLAIGNPFGVGQTVTMGIVSATGRTELGISTFENFIQTDAAINPGNSGGALITATGELIGINTAIFSRSGGSQGIGFAIPISLAKNSMEQIIEHGHVRRGWLGVEIQDLNAALAESFGLPADAKGVIIAEVIDGGPAAKAGLQTGDIIQQINGKPVGSVRSALNAIAQTMPGKELSVDGWRAGAKLSLKATVAERPQIQTQRETP